jgi:hypothetical protein
MMSAPPSGRGLCYHLSQAENVKAEVADGCDSVLGCSVIWKVMTALIDFSNFGRFTK